jgi:metallophosphoesterase (TIGR00282 family)
MKETINILAVGDIVGRPGRTILKSQINGLRDVHRVDLVIVNGENAAGGKSITPEITSDLLHSGIDVITSGNHIWDNKDVFEIIDVQPRLLRPANYPEGTRGKGYCNINYKGISIYVINLMGRTFMDPIDCPFRKFDEIYSEIENNADIIIVDFHAETTSEKRALGWYVDGRASLLFGTHTHVMTADEEILPSGTAYITDVGMTGPFDSVIGVEKQFAIEKFLYQTRARFCIATENPKMNAILCKINRNGRSESITRIIS